MKTFLETELDQQLSLGHLEFYSKDHLDKLLDINETEDEFNPHIWKYILRVHAMLAEMNAGKDLWEIKDDYLSSIIDKYHYTQVEQSMNDAMTIFLYKDKVPLSLLGLHLQGSGERHYA